ncbi:SRPBCC family protein [Nitrospirillum sp. BR 11828]|uniref:SRPBCC family protein n=1 Tax=Nitrospirillum sp. BR 11828 TaxID=3104325 RepID=UPI002ACA950D|nr:SRPBCC family protein [Nitrospirillum sp. BR 11828]MDZ5647788.1 SRPBCC family protein [Nitrospirillum sp. BR 11828]
MTQGGTAGALRPDPVRISRTIPALRETVFRAWSTAEHVKHWFAPEHYTVPEATVDMRVGGAFEVCMQAPDGTRHWTRGSFAEVTPMDRLVLDLRVDGGDGTVLFTAWTEVTFADAVGGTRLDIVQTYTVYDPAMLAAIGGAPEGWSQTLDKLGAEVARMEPGAVQAPAARSVVHALFSLERTYDAPPARVWRALSDLEAKSKWFAGGDDWVPLERSLDFRVGGRERARGRWQGGSHGNTTTTFDAHYLDIVPNERIVYSYEMHIDQRKISISLATMELKPAGDGRTTLKVTEQGAFLDGYEDNGSREHGTGFLLDQLGTSLAD